MEVISFLVDKVDKKDKEILGLLVILEPQVVAVEAAMEAKAVPAVRHVTTVKVKMTISLKVWAEAAVATAVLVLEMVKLVVQAAVDNPLETAMMV